MTQVANTSASVCAWLYMLEDLSLNSLTATDFISSPQLTSVEGPNGVSVKRASKEREKNNLSV